MVRKCIVPNCTSTDITILSHRFPRNKKLAIQWQETLNVENTSINDLFNKHVVCTKHFKKSDYRNPISNHLNYTAIPTCDVEVEEAVIDSENEYEMVELYEEEIEVLEQQQSHTEDCGEEEEHFIEDTNENDDQNQDIETPTGRETIDLYIEEEDPDNSTIKYESIDMNLSEETNGQDIIEIVEELFTNEKQNNFIKANTCKKRKIDSPIKIQEPIVLQKINLKTRTEQKIEVVPEIKNVKNTENIKIEEKPVCVKLEKSTKILEDDEISDDEDSNFKKCSRNELIKKIKNQSKKIAELEKKVKSYQKKMTVSMKTIKQLMLGNSDDDDNDDDFL